MVQTCAHPATLHTLAGWGLRPYWVWMVLVPQAHSPSGAEAQVGEVLLGFRQSEPEPAPHV